TWFWDGRALSLEEQILAAMTSPIEMYADTSVVISRLNNDTLLQGKFRTAFTQSTTPNMRDGVKAIAAFCRSLLSGNSRYDKFTRGDSSALNDAEKRGLALFNSSRTQCSSCHSGFNYTDNQYHSLGLHTHYYDEGRFYATKREQDVGKFKTPTLRNVAVSKPYMNEGLFQTLDEVMEHYNSGGKLFINKDARMKPLNLSKQEVADIVAFMKSLTDEEFLNNPKFARLR
ncbi:MAG: c-type cytochrome, partial [Candidatus Kapabacteria bacterium]|nr:c-type cytochrome [Candidatus Kapabacteria bacterium]